MYDFTHHFANMHKIALTTHISANDSCTFPDGKNKHESEMSFWGTLLQTRSLTFHVKSDWLQSIFAHLQFSI